jgi:hypothetical protein
MWCYPAKWLDIVKALPKGVIDDVKAKGFGGLLLFKPSSMDRKFLMWILRSDSKDARLLEPPFYHNAPLFVRVSLGRV